MAEEKDKFDITSCWNDGSGFEYDVAPENIVGYWPAHELHYDINRKTPTNVVGKWNLWSNWIDKFQIDYRFGQTSDQNAETILFPNVDDPWMFTEYVFQGVDQDKIIEPSLYDETTFQVKNCDGKDSDGNWSKQSRVVSDVGWDSYKEDYEPSDNIECPVNDMGVKLYKTSIKVQSVKWGQHGNIPPHTLNMCAPKNWIEPPGLLKTAIKPVVKARVGLPVYATTSGKFSRENNEEYIAPLTLTDDDPEQTDPALKTFSASEGTKVKQPKPRAVGNAAYLQLDVRYIGGASNGDVFHSGCEFFKFNNDGAGYCELAVNGSVSKSELVVGLSCYDSDNTDCIHFVKRGAQVIGTYEGIAKSKDEYYRTTYGMASGKQEVWADNVLSNTGTLPIADTMVIGGTGVNGRDQMYFREGQRADQDFTTYYDVSFDVQTVPQNPMQLNKENMEGSLKGIEVVRGTGQMSLDTITNARPFGGGDTFMFGDINQTSYHRWLQKVMLCQDICYCNDLYGTAMQEGYKPGIRAGINGEPFHCRYYTKSGSVESDNSCGCPYDGVPKRAKEFQEALKIAKPLLTNVINNWLMSSNKFPEDVEGLEYYVEEESRGYCLYAFEDKSVFFGGINCKETIVKILVKNNVSSSVTLYKVCKFRVSGVSLDGIYCWWDAYTDKGNLVSNSPWFIKIDNNFVEAKHFTVIVDNERKFVGGYHPQYKDYSKIGSEFMIDGDSDLYRDAMGDRGVGDTQYEGCEQPKVYQGYIIDESGEWILDERSTNLTAELAGDNERETASGPAPCISFKKTVTFIDPVTFERRNSVPDRCAVFANDTVAKIGSLRSTPPTYTDSDGNEVEIPPFVKYDDALPAARDVAYCSACDYYVAIRFKNYRCPWCGSEYSVKKMGKFLKINAIGKVQVWGLPGMTVPGDTYFWKNPTVVNNALVAQMRFKLGNKSALGGGYSSGGGNKSSEVTGGYTEGLGRYLPVPKFVSVKEGEENPDDGRAWEGINLDDRDLLFSYNEITNKNPLPYGFETDGINDNLIAPYATNAGLKMITMNHVRSLRNMIQPVMAYAIGAVTNPDYDRFRASYASRLNFTVPKYFAKMKAFVKPEILAANDVGNDAYVTYYSGDPEWNGVRDYYPPGCSWWRLNWLIGGRITNNAGTKYHMDDGKYGNQTLSKCIVFLHGYVPLDKELLKAYAIIKPATEATRWPVGRDYIGRMRWEHYHAFTTEHEEKGEHLHGWGGTTDFFDEEGERDFTKHWQYESDKEMFSGFCVDEYGAPEYVRKRPKNEPMVVVENPVDVVNKESSFLNLNWWIWHQGIGYESAIEWNSDIFTSISCFYDDGWYGTTGEQWGYISWNGFGTDIVQEKTEGEIWRELTTEQFEEFCVRYLCDCEISVSDGEGNKTGYDFKQWANVMIEKIIPQQMQNIPGYFNLRGINTAKRLKEKVEIAELEYDNSWQNGGQVIYQSKYDGNKPINVDSKTTKTSGFLADSGSGSDYSGNNNNEEAGAVDKVIDVTALAQGIYNERIDREFVCHAGVSLEDVLKADFVVSAWRGDGAEPVGSDRATWNSRTKDSVTNGGVTTYYGYLLNDDKHYPLTGSDGNLTAVTTDGTRYDVDVGDAVVYGTAYAPFIITESTKKLSFVLNSAAEYELDLGTFTALEMAEKINEKTLGTINAEVYGKDRLIFKSASGFEIVPVDDSCYAVLGILPGNYEKACHRIKLVSSYVEGYHPNSLLIDTANKTDDQKKAIKWLYKSDENLSQYFIVDLASTPLEEYRRDWRYRAGSIDCANVYCPNKQCETNTRQGGPYMVGIYARMKNKIMAKSQTTCPVCGSDLTGEAGVVGTTNDGIDSYYYLEGFEENAFVAKIKCDIGVSDDVLKNYKCGYSVSIRNSGFDFWETVLEVFYDKTSSKFSWFVNNVLNESETPPTEVIIEGNKRARYVRFQSNPLPSEVTITGNDGVYDVTNKTYTIVDDEWLNDELVDVIITVKDASNNSSVFNVVSNTGNVLYLDGVPTVAQTSYSFNVIKYIGGCKSLKVYGAHYQKSKLIITPPPIFDYFWMDGQTYKLKNQPTQIMDVYVGQTECNGVKLTEKTTYVDLKWKTQKIKVGDIEYKRIVGGDWYYYPELNYVVLPIIDQDGETMEIFEKDLKNVSFLPTIVSIKYWYGMGSGIEINAEALGNGPSYQLEKEAICEITSTLPNNGQSVLLPLSSSVGSVTTSKYNIPWVCYNHVHSTLEYKDYVNKGGYFRNPYLRGYELGSKCDDDEYFAGLFGDSCSKIYGVCKTVVTFYGKPDTILSGDINVKAPKKYEKSFTAGDGSTVTLYERTGGFKKNGLVIGVKLKDNGNRQTLTWEQPIVMVYLKDRIPTDKIT